jgi:hypothetical protein
VIDTEKLERLIQTVKDTKKAYAGAQVRFNRAIIETEKASKAHHEAENRLRAYMLELTDGTPETEKASEGEAKEDSPESETA